MVLPHVVCGATTARRPGGTTRTSSGKWGDGIGGWMPPKGARVEKDTPPMRLAQGSIEQGAREEREERERTGMDVAARQSSMQNAASTLSRRQRLRG